MAVYKVAQDVEAEDKLLGPFTARQFIYLIIVALAGLLAWFLSRLPMPLSILAVAPVPIILFFGALALPLRKDQPMEVYMAAMVSYYLKPRKRFWIPDGVESLVEITAPRVEEAQRTKGFTQAEAEQRLSYLADIVDTEGWAVRHAIAQPTQSTVNTSMLSDVYNDAQAVADPLDDTGAIAQTIDDMITEADAKRRQDIISHMHSPTPSAPAPEPDIADNLHFNPYPTIHQSVIQPLNPSDQIAKKTPAPEPGAKADNNSNSKSTSETAVTPDIINLISNPGLSVATVEREAHRLKKKGDDEEVIISFR